MPFTEWQPGTAIPSPTYLDASILVSANVNSDRRYGKVGQLMGELLANQANIVLSVLTLSEAMWAIAKLSYCELNNQRPGASWHKGVFERHRERIFSTYPARMRAVSDMVRSWSEAGVPIDVVPTKTSSFSQILPMVSTYMREPGLASADATHLATAMVTARSLITTDSEFQKAADDLEIFHI